MARIKEITCTISQTHNLGNYNSLRVEWSETVELGAFKPGTIASPGRAGEQEEASYYQEVCEATRTRVSKKVEELALQERPTGVTANTARRPSRE